MKQYKNRIVYGQLIKNKPCNDDLFEGGSHKHLAEVVANHIKNDEYRGLIGIDGGWGSGKSNLVGMIEIILNEDTTLKNKYHFFTYDAWAHQNDLPRRTILEEMISFLTSNNNPFEGTSHWIETLDNLLAQKRETSNKTVSSLGAGIIVSMACVLVSPIVNAIYQSIDNHWLCLWAFVPYLIIICFALHYHYKVMTKKYGQNFTTSKYLSEIFLVYAGKVKQETKHEVLIEKFR